MDAETLAELRALAAKLRTTQAAVVRQAIREMAERMGVAADGTHR
jgi:predicted transcriptional regulator